MKVRFWLAAVCANLCVGTAMAEASQGIGPWSQAEYATARLVARTTHLPAKGPATIGVHMRLEPGWHTYWRTPGDAGLPPAVSFEGSENLKRYEILWPAPKRALENGLETFVYTDEVVLPIRVRPQDSRQPLVIRLNLFYGVCREICIPVEASLRLDLAPGKGQPGAAQALIDHHLARVPVKAADQDLKIIHKPQDAMLEVRSQKPMGEPWAILEFPEGYARSLTPQSLAPDRRVARFSLEGNAPHARPRTSVPPLLLLIDGARAFEAPIR